ncbi:hypothetical protein COU80_01595 [Candidatus Peregrinibacteria bacterium CG10_big_fil_rev_8_21_14_0_10_55_24]|nr:MAG: hypothetical protein COU80_01595 [Candidatus Peregrinibacteria bacterium CG10_big_fil_rev_8_21_14_0_10_55_24]
MDASPKPYGGIVDPLVENPLFNVNGPAQPEAHPPKGRSCLAFSEAEDAAFAFIEQDMREQLTTMGLREGMDFAIDTDAVGNLFVTYFGQDAQSTVLYHSHIDSVPDGGPLDGVWGVNIARDMLLKLAQFRRETGAQTRHSLTMAVWRAEESSMTGRACVGSAVATGELTPAKLNAMQYGKNGDESTLQHHWSRYTQPGRTWNDVLDEAQNPIIRDDGTGMLQITLTSGVRNIVTAEEGHIAQAKLLQTTGNDVHIASGGIGGSIREDLVMSPETVNARNHEIAEGQYSIIDVEVIGEEAHTAGTIHNRDETMTEGGPWFRNDALVGTYILSKVLFGKGDRNRGVHVLSVEPDALTGYTKVPRRQRIRLLIRSADADGFARDALAVCQTTLRDTRNLDMRWTLSPAPAGTYRSLPKEHTIGLLSIPARMEGAPRKTDVHAADGHRVIYDVTCTGTDFVLSPEHGFSMKLDFRFTDTEHLTRLRECFAQQVQKHVFDRWFAGEEFAAFRTERSRTASGTVSAMIAERKAAIAACLGYSVIKASVLPGHDSNTLAKAKESPAEGTQVSMTIAADNGLSHNPHEAATITSLRKAQLVSQMSVACALELLGDDSEERFLGRLQQRQEHIVPIGK